MCSVYVHIYKYIFYECRAHMSNKMLRPIAENIFADGQFVDLPKKIIAEEVTCRTFVSLMYISRKNTCQ
jgi:hypothetical protein